MRLRAAFAGLVAVIAVAPAEADASGHTYTVLQCHSLNRAHADAIFHDAFAYAARPLCGDPSNDYSIKIDNTGNAEHGRSGFVRWPTGSSALGIVAVDVDAKLRRANGHSSRLWMADSQQRQVARVATGDSTATKFHHYGWDTHGHGPRQFVASLSCERSGGCRQSDAAKTWVRNVKLKVADYSDPVFSAMDGTLLGSGWLTGAHNLRADARDAGSGLDRLLMAVNGAQVASQLGSCNGIPGTSYAARFGVCGQEVILNSTLSTSQPPFHDGSNAISLCGTDFAGNRTCDERTVHVDNAPPTVTFKSAQDPNDPELIGAPVSDATSGVASGQVFYRPVGQASWRPLDTRLQSGELQARIDSTIDPPGQYEFMSQATDVAGNVTQTTTRADGQPMVLTFPLKSGVRLSGHLVPGGPSEVIGYGQPSKVAGRLVDTAGQPLASQEVAVVEHFPEGALIDRRVRIVDTDADGLWGERLPPGPSRRITASFSGSPRYLDDEASAGSLRVRTRATFRISRRRVHEGKRVLFRGRVGHLGAHVPAGGKLIELQVKDGAQWHTVREAFYTGADGGYRLRYRFARFYTSDVAYRFRVKVLRERGWPYKAPVSSRAKTLVVKAR